MKNWIFLLLVGSLAFAEPGSFPTTVSSKSKPGGSFPSAGPGGSLPGASGLPSAMPKAAKPSAGPGSLPSSAPKLAGALPGVSSTKKKKKSASSGSLPSAGPGGSFGGPGGYKASTGFPSAGPGGSFPVPTAKKKKAAKETAKVEQSDIEVEAPPKPPTQEDLKNNRDLASEMLPPPAPWDPSKIQPYVASVDVYGTSRLSGSQLKKFLGKKLDSWIALGLKGNPSAVQSERALTEKVLNKYNFALAEWTILQYFKPGDSAIHITLDVVEKKDLKKRMPFKPVPVGAYPDPDRMIEKWLDYEELALQLMDAGDLTADLAKCKAAYHCPFGHKHKKLKNYEAFFTKAVRKNQKKLLQIFSQDRRPEYRAVATYLIAYMKDPKKVVKHMMDAITDPDPSVRNNALRVLGDIAEFHPNVAIPLDPILEVLDYPRVSDRSKAAYVLYGLATHSPKVRKALIKKGIDPIIALLNSKQPSQYEVAHIILRKLSGKNFRYSNVVAWRKWFARLPANQ